MGAEMLALQAASQNVESIRTAIVAFAVIAVVFWRVLLKLVLVIVAIVLVVLLTSGAVLLYEGMHHAVR
jgi:chromate transport protein ChrA